MEQNTVFEEKTYIYGDKKQLRFLFILFVVFLPLVLYCFAVTDIWNASLIFIVYAQFMFGAGIRLFRKGPELVVSDYGIGYYKYFIFKDVIYWTDVYGFSHAKTNAIVVEHRIHIDKKGSFLSKLKRIFPERNIGFSTVFLENYDDEKLKELLYARYKNHLLRLKEEKNAKRK